MDHVSDFENSNSATAGFYRQNAFYIRMDSLFDLDLVDQKPSPFALAMHAHEYVHFLHNASTTSGQAYLLSNLILLRAFVAGSDDHGHFLGPENMPDGKRDLLHLAGKLMCAQLGTTTAKSLNSCRDISTWKCTSPELNMSDDIVSVTTDFTAKNDDGETIVQNVTIGLSFVTEGIAYEVDREIRRLSKIHEELLDTNTKNFPYLAYAKLLDSWSGRRLTAQERIGVGVCALVHRFSGYLLAQICSELKKTDLPVFEVLKKARKIHSGESELVLSHIREQRCDLGKEGVIWTAMGEYMKLAEAGVKLRQKRWAPELVFLSSRLTSEKLRSHFGTMLDCLIMQCKPEGKLDIYWIGPGHIARSFETSQYLGVLQSAIHFSQLHLSAKGEICPTLAFRRRVVSCPFSGGCASEIDDQYPDACKSAPWERFAFSAPEEKVCWYAAGVKALRKPSGAPPTN